MNTKRSTKNITNTENVTNKINSETFHTKQPKVNDDGINYQLNTKGQLDVMALVAIMELATENQFSKSDQTTSEELLQ